MEKIDENIKIISDNGKGTTYIVPRDILKESKFLEPMIEDICEKTTIIPLDIKDDYLNLIIEYLKNLKKYDGYSTIPKPLESNNLNEIIKDFEIKFLEDVISLKEEFPDKLPIMPLATMLERVNFLCINPLIELLAAKIASMFKGKSEHDVKKMCGKEGDFSQEDIDEVSKSHPWIKKSDDTKEKISETS